MKKKDTIITADEIIDLVYTLDAAYKDKIPLSEFVQPTQDGFDSFVFHAFGASDATDAANKGQRFLIQSIRKYYAGPASDWEIKAQIDIVVAEKTKGLSKYEIMALSLDGKLDVLNAVLERLPK